ncbi:TMEM165/GDT1 family protein, partial [Dehalococcoidia bacterium]|nr:TMEM165/GDT1 family protein [Dehalococcoidia bacterium]
QPFITAFLATSIAGIGDKTQLVTLTMSSRGSPRQVFLGAMLALALVTGLGVALGELVADLFPGDLVALGSGLFFLFMGIHTYFREYSARSINSKGNSPFGQTFGLVFLAEMGDKTQLTAMALTATFSSPLLVFSGAMLGQALNHGIATFLGARYLSLLPDRFLKIATLLLFVFFGLLMIYGGLQEM